MVAGPTGRRENLSVVLNCISLTANDVEYLKEVSLGHLSFFLAEHNVAFISSFIDQMIGFWDLIPGILL